MFLLARPWLRHGGRSESIAAKTTVCQEINHKNVVESVQRNGRGIEVGNLSPTSECANPKRYGGPYARDHVSKVVRDV